MGKSSTEIASKANDCLDAWRTGEKLSYLLKAVKLNPSILHEKDVKEDIANWQDMAINGEKLQRKIGYKNLRDLCKLLYEMARDRGKNGKVAKEYLKEHISPTILFILNRKTRGPLLKGFFEADIIKLAIWKSTSLSAEKILARHYEDNQKGQARKATDLERLFSMSGIQMDERLIKKEWLIEKCHKLERNDIARFLTAYKLGMTLNTFDKKHLARLNKLYEQFINEMPS